MITHRDKSGFISPSRGVTLIELLVTMSVLAILLAVGVPSFGQFTSNNRLNNFSNSLFSNLALARSEAIKRSGRVVICKSADGSACSGTEDWSQGWIIFADVDNDASMDNGEQIIHRMPTMPAGYRFVGNSAISNYVSYDAQGMTKLTSGAFQAGTFTLCPPEPAIAGSGRQIILSSSGRARTVKITTCP
ncbi:MAG: GspH/FimT family pseudopilin [Nitrosomonas sp.]|nr:GspH/FimT family pseudopilin [Nitrosomonas sp.]MDP1950412.1 GspH/FimT family pseudopilin [Nitrosomonas sp.]